MGNMKTLALVAGGLMLAVFLSKKTNAANTIVESGTSGLTVQTGDIVSPIYSPPVSVNAAGYTPAQAANLGVPMDKRGEVAALLNSIDAWMAMGYEYSVAFDLAHGLVPGTGRQGDVSAWVR